MLHVRGSGQCHTKVSRTTRVNSYWSLWSKTCEVTGANIRRGLPKIFLSSIIPPRTEGFYSLSLLHRQGGGLADPASFSFPSTHRGQQGFPAISPALLRRGPGCPSLIFSSHQLPEVKGADPSSSSRGNLLALQVLQTPRSDAMFCRKTSTSNGASQLNRTAKAEPLRQTQETSQNCNWTSFPLSLGLVT
ncbi:unnamed protein product [Pleuronectes platessa]|uniref:Uncharacterized protein n=1 Tax=Pleuronectes platessa TaxID=8262 RepID=A0A9N7U5I3_PLEPL|nr:unnamed protein product [Pleuronectes platessa]